jgi:hypothetical protein
MWNLILVRLDTLLLSVQDRFMVCAERTTGLEIVLTKTMELLGDVGHVKSCFNPFGDYVSVSPFGDSANREAR